jgi:CheY-like chemotaxis protein
MNETGIEIFRDVTWGNHFCQFYQTKQDLIDIIVPFFYKGLQQNELCICITAPPLPFGEAQEALRQAVPDLDDHLQRGQIEILDYRQWYTVTGKFDAHRVLQGGIEKEFFARRKGYEGLRVTGNISWLEKRDWKDFSEYEAAINAAIDNRRMIVLCSYCLEKCGAREMIDVMDNHQFALIKQSGDWKVIRSRNQQNTLRGPFLWASFSAPEKSDAPLPSGSAADPSPAQVESGETTARIRVLVADDHTLFRKGLLEVLSQEPDVEVVAEAADGEMAVEQAKRHRPLVVLMDLTMPNLDGIEATRRIAAALPGVRIIGLSAHQEEDMAQALYQAGAVSYLSKGQPVESLLSTIRDVAARPSDR